MIPKTYIHSLLSLICDLNQLVLSTQRHSRRILLCTDSPSLTFILHERNTPSSRHKSDLPEALKAPEDRRQSIDIVLLWQILHEENLVRWQVLVGDNSCASGIRRLETSTTSGFDGTGSCGGGIGDDTRALEEFLRFGLFCGLFLVCDVVLAKARICTSPAAMNIGRETYPSPPTASSCDSQTHPHSPPS